MPDLSAIHRAAPQPLGKSAARPHPVRAPRGSLITRADGRIEAACRRLPSKLDPEVAENPDALVGA